MPTSFPRKFVAVFAFLALFASTGCIEFGRTISLNKDLSGKATFRMSMNMEPMARFAATMEKGGGVPTEEEVQKAIKEMSEGMAKESTADLKSQVGPLPAGFTLLDVVQKAEGLKMVISFTVGFQDIRKLSTLKLADPSPTGSSDKEMQPFDGIEVKDEGQTILITAKLLTTGDAKMMAPKAEPGTPVDPAAAQGITDALKGMLGGMGGEEAMKNQFEAMIKEMKETFRFETPMTIVETNATKRETGAATWEHSLEALAKAQTAPAAGNPPVMTIRIKK